jgi:branched-chain amino acid transport system substrate-binding protein
MRGRIVIAGLVIVAGCGGGAPAEPVRIGLIAPVTGPLSAVGEAMQTAAVAAVADVNAGGGVGGRTLELLVGDDMLAVDDAPDVEELATQMLDQGVVAFVGPIESAFVTVVVEVAAPRGVPVVTPSASDPGLFDFGWLFHTAPPEDEQGPALDFYLGDVVEPPITSATIVRFDESMPDRFADDLEVRWPGAPVIAYTSPLDDTSAAALWAAIAAAGGDVAVFTGFGEDANALLRAWAADGTAPGFTWLLGGLCRASNLFLPTLPPLPASAAGIRGVARILIEVDGESEPFAAQTTDTVVLVAAALALRAHDGGDLRAALDAVSKDGEVIRTDNWPAVAAAIDAGLDIDLDGLTGSLDLDASGNTHAFHEIWQLVQDPIAGWVFEQIEVLDPRDY